MSENSYTFGPFLLDTAAARLSRDGVEIGMQPLALKLLEILASRAGEVLTKEELVQELWPDSFVSDDSLVQLVRRVRRALGEDARKPRYLATVHRRGYRWEATPAGVPERPPGVPRAPPTSFVGRDRELDAIAELLGSGARLVTLLGTAGAGKTRLSHEFAALHRESWPGGVWFCDLTQARATDEIAASVQVAMGLAEESGDPVNRVGNALCHRDATLVILDNFEQVIACGAETVGRWMRAAPASHFLVTSRVSLGLEGEHVLPIDALPLEDAVQLFVARARAAQPDFDAEGVDRRELEQIVERLDRLCLAIEIAAARVVVLSVAELLERLSSRRFETLRSRRRDVLERQASIEGAIAWSWDLLQPWEQEALAQLSVFRGGFTLDAAERVVNLEAWAGRPEILEVVQALVEASLLRTVRRGRRSRFGMYVAIREYSQQKLALPEPTIARHAAWYGRMEPENPPQDVVDLDNMLAAARAPTAKAEDAARAAIAATHLMQLTGRGGAGELAEDVLRRKVPSRLRGWLWLAVVRAHRREGRPVLSRSALDRAAEEANTCSDPVLTGQISTEEGITAWEEGRLDDARDHQRRALASWREIGDRAREAEALGHLGHLDGNQGRYDDARVHYEAALKILRASGRRPLGRVLCDLGSLHGVVGRIEQAKECLAEAIRINRKSGDVVAEGAALTELGWVVGREGEVELAHRRFEAALALHRRVDCVRHQAVTLCFRGGVRLRVGDIEGARTSLLECLELARRSGSGLIEASARSGLSEVCALSGQLEEAARLLDLAQPPLEEASHRWFLVELHVRRGSLNLLRGDRVAAQDSLVRARHYFEELGDPPPLSSKLEGLRDALEASCCETGTQSAFLPADSCVSD